MKIKNKIEFREDPTTKGSIPKEISDQIAELLESHAELEAFLIPFIDKRRVKITALGRMDGRLFYIEHMVSRDLLQVMRHLKKEGADPIYDSIINRDIDRLIDRLIDEIS